VLGYRRHAQPPCAPRRPLARLPTDPPALPTTIAALALTALAFALRVTALDLESLWFDTAHSGVVALNPSLGEVLQGAAADFQSPLYFVLLHTWLAVAQSDFWLAFPSAAAGTLIVPLAFTLGRRLFSPGAGLVAALVCATTTYQVYYSRYPRGYILLAFLALLAAYWLHRALVPGPGEQPVPRHRLLPWLAHAAAVVAASYTQPYAFFIVAAMWLAGGFYALARRPRALPPLIGAAAAVAVAYAPWLGVTAGQMSSVKGGADAWIEPVSRDSLKTLWDWLWFKTRGEYGLPVDLPLRAGRYLLTLLMAVAAVRLVRRFGTLFTLALTLGPVVLAFGFSVVVVTLWDARYLVSVSPFFALWLGAAVANAARSLAPVGWLFPILPMRWAPVVLTALLAAMALPPLWSLYADPAYRAANLRAALSLVHGGYRPGDAIVHTNYQSYLPALWYDHQQPERGDGPHPAPCVWASLPPAWCAGSPYREVYVNPALTTFDGGVRDVHSGWLLVLYNHNKLGDADAQLAEARGRAAAQFTIRDVYRFTGVYVLRLEAK